MARTPDHKDWLGDQGLLAAQGRVFLHRGLPVSTNDLLLQVKIKTFYTFLLFTGGDSTIVTWVVPLPPTGGTTIGQP
ncbi:hypothetical protein B296_00001112 [Ensete ventricosum]|uniref:Uncharacterized protein n=1 Tax=Ensete ventricosum TaxID=4639 RepID=A0A427A9B6_ENSVE|nr:hypothetical protein B296_00001112 [Ensete ventricosum]